MQTWLTVILEIIKITIPALIVYLTVFNLLKTYLDKKYQLNLLESRTKQQGTTIPMRFQAYERLALFCERIAIPALLLRLRQEEQTSGQLRLTMMLSIQQEFEYNVTQQVYVSDQLWQIIKIARDETASVIEAIAERVDPVGPSKEMAALLLRYVESQPATALDKALGAIKKETSLLL